MALLYNSANAFVNCGSNNSLNNLVLKSISSWVNFSSNASNPRIVAKFSNAVGKGWIFYCNGGNNTVNYYHTYSVTNSEWNTPNTTATTNTLNHLVVTYDDSSVANNPTIYINGASQSLTATVPVGVFGGDSSFLLCLCSGTESTNGVNTGSLMEQAIWNTILTPDDVMKIYKSKLKGMPLQIKPANLVGYWPCDDFTNGLAASGASSIRDRSSSGNHGTPGGSPVGLKEPLFSRQP